MKTEAGVMLSHAKKQLRPPEAARVQEGFFPRVQREHGSADFLMSNSGL